MVICSPVWRSCSEVSAVFQTSCWSLRTRNSTEALALCDLSSTFRLYNCRKMGIFLQLYNLKVDDKSHRANASVEFRVRKDQQEVWKTAETSEQLRQTGEQITIERLLPLNSLQPGRYKLEIRATDQLTNQTILRTADFTVKPAVAEKIAEKKAPGR